MKTIRPAIEWATALASADLGSTERWLEMTSNTGSFLFLTLAIGEAEKTPETDSPWVSIPWTVSNPRGGLLTWREVQALHQDPCGNQANRHRQHKRCGPFHVELANSQGHRQVLETNLACPAIMAAAELAAQQAENAIL